MDATPYIQTELLEWLVNGTAFDTAPTSIYVALHNGEPGADASSNELTFGGYSRYQSTAGSDWTIPSTGNFENANDFVFGEATEDWGTVSHFSIWDGPDATDNALAEDALVSSVTINSGDSPAFRAGKLSGTFE